MGIAEKLAALCPKDEKKKRVLDVACGNGDGSRCIYAAMPWSTVMGIDR